MELVASSPLFDDGRYVKEVSETIADRQSAAEHYLQEGAARGFEPNLVFSGAWYLARYPDVAADGINPFVHFLLRGQQEGRDPHPLFDVSWYLEQGDLAAVDRARPLEHFLKVGFREARSPHPLFDCRWYYERYPEVAETEVNPLIDYLTDGVQSGRDPHPLFDTRWYLGQNLDVARAGVNPLIHYVLWGGAELRSPFEGFDAAFVKSYSRGYEPQTETPLATYARAVGTRDFRAAYLNAELSKAIAGRSLEPATVAVGTVVHGNPISEFVRLARSVRTCVEDDGSVKLVKLLLSNGDGDYSGAAGEHDFVYLHAQENRGFGAAHNVLMRKAFADGADVYIAANPDGFFHPECISRLVRASQFFGNTSLLEASQFPEEHPKIFDPVSLNTAWASG
ncbi:MAG: glycosyltransferase family 2 protein, partial [Bradyrhizobium sp.]